MAQMTAEQAAEWGKTLDFPTVWAAIMKGEARSDKADERFDKMSERFDQLMKKIDRVTENVGGLNRSIGELVEILIAARLWEKFPEYDLQRAYRRIPLYDEKNIPKAEVDILLANTEWVMAVEVKAELEPKDVERHIERMGRILKYPPPFPAMFPANAKLLGAVAGGIVTPEAQKAAHNAGFFVLELAGEQVIRVQSPADFKPKEWGTRGPF